MGLALLMMTFGGMLVYSSLKNQGILDVFAGKPSDPITPKDYSSYSAAAIDNVVAGPPIPGTVSDSKAVNTKGVKGVTNYDGFPVAGWITPILTWARSHGWQGKVYSGYRDPKRVIIPGPGLPVAPQGKSNHNTTAYPGGAVDVTEAAQLEQVLRKYPHRPTLIRGTAIGDPVHFSHNGR